MPTGLSPVQNGAGPHESPAPGTTSMIHNASSRDRDGVYFTDSHTIYLGSHEFRSRLLLSSARVRALLPLVIVTIVLVSAIAWTTWARANHVFPFCGGAIWDTSWTPRSIGNLTKSSAIILIGSIAQVGPSWQPEVGPIITRITVNSSEVLKGGQWPRTQISLVASGGTIGCYSDSVGGEASFTEGEQVLVR